MIFAVSKVLSQSQQHRLVSLSSNVIRNVSFPEGGVQYSVGYSSVGRFGPSSPSKVYPNSDIASLRLQLNLSGKQPHVPIPISKCLPNTEGLKPKTSSTIVHCFCSVEDASFPKRVTGIRGNFSKAQCRQGDTMAFLFLRTLADTGKPWLNPPDPSFLWTGPVSEFVWSLVFLFTPPGFSHWSAVPCRSYHPGGVLLGQRIRTTKRETGQQVRSSWELVKVLILRLFPLFVV